MAERTGLLPPRYSRNVRPSGCARLHSSRARSLRAVGASGRTRVRTMSIRFDVDTKKARLLASLFCIYGGADVRPVGLQRIDIYTF